MKTTMNKAYPLSLAVLFCFLALPVRGQKALDGTARKASLEKELEPLKKDLSDVKYKIENTLIQIENDSIRNNELKKTYNSLTASVSRDSMDALRRQVVSLEDRQQSLQVSINSLKKEISDRNAELRKVDSELQDMNVYSEIQRRQSYKTNKLYLTKRYSVMTIEKLTGLSNRVDEYKSFDGYADYKKRIAASLKNKRIFDDAWNCVSTGSGYQDVVGLREGIIALLEIERDDSRKGIFKLSDGQYHEMDSLDVKLSRFNGGIKELQSIVARVNADEEIVRIRNAKKPGSKRECINRMRLYVVPEKGSEGARVYERYFKVIPYLEKLLGDYWKELKADPFDTPTKTEKIITDLVAE